MDPVSCFIFSVWRCWSFQFGYYLCLDYVFILILHSLILWYLPCLVSFLFVFALPCLSIRFLSYFDSLLSCVFCSVLLPSLPPSLIDSVHLCLFSPSCLFPWLPCVYVSPHFSLALSCIILFVCLSVCLVDYLLGLLLNPASFRCFLLVCLFIKSCPGVWILGRDFA